LEQRQKDITLAKATVEFQWYEVSKQQQHVLLAAAPDPHDPTISKRSWKYRVSCWRTEIIQRYQEYQENLTEQEVRSVVSMVSADDCHSITTSAGSTRASGSCEKELEDHEDDTPSARTTCGEDDENIIAALC
jgi:hypothetical protein